MFNRYRAFSALALAVAAMVAAPAAAGADGFPLKLENCGVTLQFDKVPASVVSIGQGGSEMLYALGLGSKVVGTALWFNDVMPAFRAVDAKVARLSDNAPSFEAVVGKRPALVLSQFEWMVGKNGVVATRERFRDLGIATYSMPSDCEGKDNRIGADGTRTAAYDVGTLHKSIRQLSRIFDVRERGDALVRDLTHRQAEAVARVGTAGVANLSAALWFSSSDLAADPFAAGRKGVAGYMLQALGLRNVVQSNEEWPTVGWETIARANPSILVIARMDRRRFPADDYRRKLAFLRNDPVTRRMDAVVHDRIVIVDADALQGSIRMVEAMEQIAEAVTKLGEAGRR